ncbi:3-hydroxy-3-methylglutaryl-coenzyme A reductase [Nesidiocoris tenuis]|uniref:3-hydroxy-3-methylglutaryl coenzyme A reductase n=1 Tax=Nesidiocoris tenuis TaxID=355587 RepID=A0ABN7BIJ2_9HEMI|nr:3-hydroxy-3-methylglutaryl-coenzyme A reductase [Nesidiocoris tenuis]
MYRLHGEFCANHPWEVIVATLTLGTCLFTIDSKFYLLSHARPEPGDINIDTVVMTLVRCVAILYSYYKFRTLKKQGSLFLGVPGIFTVISSFIFSSSAISCFGGDVSDVKDALFCFLLLIDLSKATKLAQFALSGERHQIKANIARGLGVLGPSLTLDTIVETLLISVGTLSGIRRLELLCYFASVSVIVNYIVFMSFYPACLSLVLELYDNFGSKIPWDFNKISEDEKPNPVIQRVKIIMSAGLAIVHLQNRWTDKEENMPLIIEEYNNEMKDSPSSYFHYFRVSADQIVVFILLVALTVKFMFFEEEDFVTDTEPKPVPVKSKKLEKIAAVEENREGRSKEECLDIFKRDNALDILHDDEIESLIGVGSVSSHTLEKYVEDKERAVKIRRIVLGKQLKKLNVLRKLPYEHYDYDKVYGACCENVIGYVPVPLGIAGPLNLDGETIQVPMATTEGCLVASTNRGCRAVAARGVISRLVDDGMTRGPVVRFENIDKSAAALKWINDPHNFDRIKNSFDSTSRFAKLTKVQVKIAGRLLYIRFVATTGDAMGMNMVSKGTEAALNRIQQNFPDMEILSLSGNYCADKKATAVNWIEGRGKYVVCEAVIAAEDVRTILKTSVAAMVDLNISKNLIGSAVAGSIGGFNAHAANIVTAVYIATGQDPAQVVTSANCITLMEPTGSTNEDLYISVTMPSVEVGTVGGGTQLPAQSSCLELLDVQGSNRLQPGRNAGKLARIICATVLAGELSLMAALASGHLVRSHLKHNRSAQCLTRNS